MRNGLVGGALGLWRMREMGAGTGIRSGGFAARLGATDGPPARCVFGKFTHLAATCGSLRLRAATVTTTCGDFANAAGGVCPNGEGRYGNEK